MLLVRAFRLGVVCSSDFREGTLSIGSSGEIEFLGKTARSDVRAFLIHPTIPANNPVVSNPSTCLPSPP
jgi:hypothetical protein